MAGAAGLGMRTPKVLPKEAMHLLSPSRFYIVQNEKTICLKALIRSQINSDCFETALHKNYNK